MIAQERDTLRLAADCSPNVSNDTLGIYFEQH